MHSNFRHTIDISLSGPLWHTRDDVKAEGDMGWLNSTRMADKPGTLQADCHVRLTSRLPFSNSTYL
jgi:hypothetical protein